MKFTFFDLLLYRPFVFLCLNGHFGPGIMIIAILLFFLASTVRKAVADSENAETEDKFGVVTHQVLKVIAHLRGLYDLVVVAPDDVNNLLPFLNDPLTLLSCSDPNPPELNTLTGHSQSVMVLSCDLETNVSF